MLLACEAESVDYPESVIFRPPNLACASEEVILCAASARLSLSEYVGEDSLEEDGSKWTSQDDDGAVTLELLGVSQLVPRGHRSLPTLSEQDVESSSAS